MLIRRNQRYAGSQIAVAATIAAATTNAAVPRIGIVIRVLTDTVAGRLPLTPGTYACELYLAERTEVTSLSPRVPLPIQPANTQADGFL